MDESECRYIGVNPIKKKEKKKNWLEQNLEINLEIYLQNLEIYIFLFSRLYYSVSMCTKLAKIIVLSISF